MASGFIGQVEMQGINDTNSQSSSSLSYSAPSTVAYSVVSISESASIIPGLSTTTNAHLRGFSVSATANKDSTEDVASGNATSNDIRLILGPGETVSIQGEVSILAEGTNYSYTGSMSVLEVD